MKMTESHIFKYVTIGIIAFWLIVFVFFPNILVFIVSFLTRDEANLIALDLTFDNYLKLLDPIYLQVLIDSVIMAFVTTVLCLIAAFPFSYILSRVQSASRKNILLMLIIIPFWTSALIRTYAIKIILTTNGLINTFLLKLDIIDTPLDMLYTQGAVITGLVYTLLPFMILPLYATLEKFDTRVIEAASDLGANKFHTFVRIVIPLSAPGIVAGSLLVFLPALGLFYIPDILGGSKTLLIGNLVKNQFMDSRNWPFGSAVSMMLTIIMALLLLANYRSIKSMSKKGVL
ncbi:MAG: spermidine/putrescine ABC transporter permease PotB [Deferribacteraceae bacterium]|jgi:spermidine/putrescine transport system permease protein|nr:spermidine/putrescine ABC transporter permease PotB [Deferribacteraceae bacterium]